MAKNLDSGSSRTYVVRDGEAVVGIYCLVAGAIRRADAPSAKTRNWPDPTPVLVLGRFAIHKNHPLKGIGTALLNDAIRRAVQPAATVATSVAVR